MTIGKVSFLWTDPPGEAVLDDDFVWTSDYPLLTALLNSDPRFNRLDISPADGIPGRLKVITVADTFGGKASFPARDRPDSPGLIY